MCNSSKQSALFQVCRVGWIYYDGSPDPEFCDCLSLRLDRVVVRKRKSDLDFTFSSINILQGW